MEVNSLASFLDKLDYLYLRYDYVVDLVLVLLLTHGSVFIIAQNILLRKIRRILKCSASDRWKVSLINEEVK